MAKYGRKAAKKVKRAVHEQKRGELKTGSGKKVTSRKQAIAIGLSEAREEGAKVPSKRGTSGRKKSGSAKKSSSAKKSAGSKKSASSKSRGRKK
ncbi:MAG: DUF6496 domain-containing protein [Vicinamibacterales bacterium]